MTEIIFSGRADLIMEHDPIICPVPRLKACEINLETSKNISKAAYFTSDDLPNEAGCKVLTNCFIHGLASLITAAHHAGYMNEADNMRYVIEELQKIYIAQRGLQDGEFTLE